MKHIAIWQITVPLSIISTFATASLTAIQMTNGRYTFDLEITHRKFRIKTEMYTHEQYQDNDLTQDRTEVHDHTL